MKYLGNKKRLSEFLVSSLDLPNRKGHRALDLFVGTGSVSLLFKRHGLNTVSNDFMRFASVRAAAILRDEPPLANKKLLTTIVDGFITNKYSEKAGINIFRTDIARHIDGARSVVPVNPTNPDDLYYLAQIIEAADFRSNIMGSYESFYKKGWRKQCDKPWSLPLFDLVNNQGKTTHEVHNEDAVAYLKQCNSDFDLIYLDPPYNNRQYSSVFHVLETIALQDQPKTTGTINKRHITEEKKSKFSMKRKCLSEMDTLLSLCSERSSEVFLSYSNEGIIDLQELSQLFTKHFDSLTIHEVDYRRFKTNERKPMPTKVKEVILHGSK